MRASSSKRCRCRRRASCSPTYLVVHGTPNLPADQWSGRSGGTGKKRPCRANPMCRLDFCARPCRRFYLAIARLQGNAWQLVNRRRPRCIVIAGPNGSGKTTFAREYLPRIARVVHFVNADLIAGGLSPLKPELAAIAAARMVLREIDRLAAERVDFAFETTLSGRTYLRRIETWKRAGYRIEIVYLRLKLSRSGAAPD